MPTTQDTKLTTKTMLNLPDILQDWPWGRQINTHHETVASEATVWLQSFKAFSPKAQDAFDRCNFNLIASLAYPTFGEDALRVACDLMNLYFVIDEHTDVDDGQVTEKKINIVKDALRNPSTPRPEGEWIGGEITRQFWVNALKFASPASKRYFSRTFNAYLDAVIEEADDRDDDRVRSIEAYFENRRNNVGVQPCWGILLLPMDIPEEALARPEIKKLEMHAVDMIAIDNDLLSYNVEQAKGSAAQNLVTVVMNEHQCDVHRAMAWMVDLHAMLAQDWLETYSEILPGLDEQLALYVDGIGNWVRAINQYSFESERYFGKDGMEVQKQRMVEMLAPKSKPHMVQL